MIPGRAIVRGTAAFMTLAYLFVSVVLLLAALTPTAFGYRSLVIRSGSMGNAIPIGAVAVISPATSDAYYDVPTVVTYQGSREMPVTHRIVAVTQDEAGAVRYTTRGDANVAEDPLPVPHALVMGAVRGVIPLVGWPAVWLQRGMMLQFLLWAGTTAALAGSAVILTLPARAAQVQRVQPSSTRDDHIWHTWPPPIAGTGLRAVHVGDQSFERPVYIPSISSE